MKGLIIQQQQQQQQQHLVEENMSNLTSASGEAAASVSSNQNQSSFVSPINPNPVKKRRNLPGNPDPDAEVMALSPKTLMATNRFVCEICNKGFQRDQNLQLHRRGHNLPWKLKQRTNKEIKKKVYICPEVSCVHHDPARALGDLTGIKKHFSRKHGEKKWKCEKCSKKYAVQSDWKAHSKICGTREYRCDCGTLFSRRDSFITHRAFCDALAEESARAITNNNPLANNHHPLLFSHHSLPLITTSEANNTLHQDFTLKREAQDINIPPWLQCNQLELQSSMYQTSLQQEFSQAHQIQSPSTQIQIQSQNPIQNLQPPHMSATALLQKAAQMGATMSMQPHQMAPTHNSTNGSSNVFGLGSGPNSLLHQDMMMASLPSTSHGFDGNNNGGISDGTTRDFLGLRGALSHRDILNIAGLDHCMSSSSYDNKKSWN